MQKNKKSTDEFTTWLQGQLKILNTDPDIFGSYIVGILEGEETPEEKREALNDILGEIITNDLDALINVLLEKWEKTHPKEEVKKAVHVDVNEQLAKLLEAQKLQTIVKEREYTDEERKIREQILAQYSQTEVEDEDAYESEEEVEKTNTGATGIERNTNVQDVMALQKEKREQARLESAAKKQKDKEDRERQKQMREEKKEKRKTVKGERRR
ncbi:coiled-coil domain-containing protein 43 [Rhagoletis pomonella]|uniref:coiled-coil domain-containing protein 43 n=1 Tax=Rhagoletis pomonella TaxID=28610 RepID=UPI00177CD725|nr:coiled-coil domain-containing protein 43 [Rhagoletis pomonella]